MKRLIRFLKGYEKESFLAPLFKMLEATFELIVPLVVARIMDIGITKGVEIYVRKVAPLGDPMEVTVRGYELSVRKADAQMIDVE